MKNKQVKLLIKIYQDLFKNKVRILHGAKVFESDYKKLNKTKKFKG